jgi:hypothetical protein
VHAVGSAEAGFTLLRFRRRPVLSDTEHKPALRSIVDVWTEWQCPGVLSREATEAQVHPVNVIEAPARSHERQRRSPINLHSGALTFCQ